jgi:hypothetical protein
MRHAAYARSQPVTLLWVITPITLVGVGLVLFMTYGAAAWPGLVLLGLATLLPLLLLGRLTVEVGADAVEWRFGWLSWPRWRQPLNSIQAVELTTSTASEGWGIRVTRTGKLYNASGSGAVRLHLKNGSSLRLGSDEPARLAGFIQARLPQPPGPPPGPHARP